VEIAAKFSSGHSRSHHAVAGERLEIEHQRLLHDAVNEELVPRRIDVGNAGMHDGEMLRDRARPLATKNALSLCSSHREHQETNPSATDTTENLSIRVDRSMQHAILSAAALFSFAVKTADLCSYP
jgi:hypothetical protein